MKMLATIAAVATLAASPATAVDGCWRLPLDARNLVEVSVKPVPRYANGRTKVHVRITNRTGSRLFVKWCVDDACGFRGLDAQESTRQFEYTDDLRPQVTVEAVGSFNPDNDWKCWGKLR